MQITQASAYPIAVAPISVAPKAASPNLSIEIPDSTLSPVDQTAATASASNPVRTPDVVYTPQINTPPGPARNDSTPNDTDASAAEADSDADSSSTSADGKSNQNGITDERSQNNIQLTEAELKEVRRLASRDREVKAHEQAHASVGGQYAGSASFTYERGPDGLSYAVGGEVPINVAPVAGDPLATIAKMGQVRRAALAPADPSAQDRSVAAQATQQLLQAQTELLRGRSQASNEGTPSDSGDASEDSPSKIAANSSDSRQIGTYKSLSRLDDSDSSDSTQAQYLNEIV